jgi:hypothetical protein
MGKLELTYHANMQGGDTRQNCPQKAALLDEYQQATRRHAVDLEKLQMKTGTTSRAEYQILYDAAEALRNDARAAQRALETHIAEHGC